MCFMHAICCISVFCTCSMLSYFFTPFYKQPYCALSAPPPNKKTQTNKNDFFSFLFSRICFCLQHPTVLYTDWSDARADRKVSVLDPLGWGEFQRAFRRVHLRPTGQETGAILENSCHWSQFGKLHYCQIHHMN